MSFFNSILGKEPCLGIDIGTTSIKVAELVSDNEGVSLNNYAILETSSYLDRANSALQTSTLKLSEDQVAGYLRLALQTMETNSKSAILSVPSFAAFSTLIEIPAASEREMENIMQFQAKQYIPLPLNQVTLDWEKVGTRTGEDGVAKSQIFLVAIVNEFIERMQKVCMLAGLTLKGVEIEGVCLARSLARESKEPILIIDIGGRSTGIFVAAEGKLKWGAQTDFSGGSLTQTLANGLNINMRRAEQLKRERGLSESSGEQELSTLMEVILDVILNEASRVAVQYEAAYKEKISGLVFSGGGASMVGLTDYVARSMTYSVTIANPFSRVRYPNNVEPILKDLGPLLAVAMGLGLKLEDA